MDIRRSVELLLFRHSDLKSTVPQKLVPITLCKEINSLLNNSVKCIQQFVGVWRVYLNLLASRNNLIEHQFISINKRRVKIYEINPFDNKFVNHERILIKDLPYSVSDNVLCNFLTSFEFVKLESIVLYGKVMDGNGKISNVDNGDRFVYAQADIFFETFTIICEYRGPCVPYISQKAISEMW